MKTILITGSILFGIVAISQVIVNKITDDTGTIKYNTLSKKEGYDIRLYPTLVVATTKLKSRSFSKNSSNGFKNIASYIFGGNSSDEQIPMTSPVQMDLGKERKMSFFMPENYKIEDLPEPDNKNVTLSEQEAKTVAVITFSGWANDEIIEQKYLELKTKLLKDGILFQDTYSSLGYNPPYQLINRKNEVIIQLIDYKN
jgi:effector-binding domain-containing protein